MKAFTIIMVARNHLEQTQKALTTLHKHTDPSKYKLLFMDNGSTDHTDSWLTHWCREKGIELQYQYYPENRGWIAAINNAYEIVDTEYALTCHNDVKFSKQWLDRMMQRFKNKNVAAVGPVITFAMGPQSMHYAHLTFNCEVKYLLGLFFLCRMDVLRQVKEVTDNYLPVEYGMGDKEELELCWYIRKLGYQLEIARDVVIEHDGEKSFVDLLGSQSKFYEYQQEQLKTLRTRLGDETVEDIYKVEIKNPIKLMIGILTRTEYIHYRNMISFLKIYGNTQVYKTFYHVARGHPASGRNAIVKAFLKTECTHLLFIDDDMVFDQDAVNKLLAMDVDIATGIAYQRGEPFAPCTFLFNAENKSFYPVETGGCGHVQVDAIGGYFFVIKRKVLETVQKPWFVYGDTSLGYNDSDDPDNRGIGEDIYFSAKAKHAGFEIWVNGDVEIGHIGQEQIINTDFYKEYKDSGKLEKFLNKEFKEM